MSQEKEYKVHLKMSHYEDVVVMASSEEEALEKANLMCNTSDAYSRDYSSVEYSNIGTVHDTPFKYLKT